MADAFYSWQQVYREALNEPDVTKLADRIIAAERALATRSQRLVLSRDRELHKDHFRELQAISEAAKKLTAVRIERLKSVPPGINGCNHFQAGAPRLPLNYRKSE